MFLYRDILKKSLAITWGHKYLWLFGIFAALFAGFGQYFTSMSRAPENWSAGVFSGAAIFYGSVSASGNCFANLAALFKKDPVSAAIFIIFVLITIALSLFLLWLAVVSQAGLINNGTKIILGGKKETSTIKEGIEAGLANFWPVLGFNAIAAALICFFAALVGLPLVFLGAQADISVYLLYILLFVLFIPLALIVSFLARYAICFVVIKGEKFIDAFVEAYRLFEKNWLVSIELAFLLFMIEFVYVVLLGLIFLVLAIPFVFLTRVLSLAIFLVVGVDSFFPLALLTGLLIVIMLVVLAGAAITVFKAVAWTDIFITLVDKKGGLAKIVRLATGFRK
jgi:hypothetical protein